MKNEEILCPEMLHSKPLHLRPNSECWIIYDGVYEIFNNNLSPKKKRRDIKAAGNIYCSLPLLLMEEIRPPY